MTGKHVVESHGTLRATVSASCPFGCSKVTQVIQLNAGPKRIDVDIEIDWHIDPDHRRVPKPAM